MRPKRTVSLWTSASVNACIRRQKLQQLQLSEGLAFKNEYSPWVSSLSLSIYICVYVSLTHSLPPSLPRSIFHSLSLFSLFVSIHPPTSCLQPRLLLSLSPLSPLSPPFPLSLLLPFSIRTQFQAGLSKLRWPRRSRLKSNLKYLSLTSHLVYHSKIHSEKSWFVNRHAQFIHIILRHIPAHCIHVYIHIHIYTYTYIYIYKYIHIHIYTYTYIYIYIYIHIHIYIYIYIYIHVYMYVYLCVRVCMYVCIMPNAYAYIQTVRVPVPMPALP